MKIKCKMNATLFGFIEDLTNPIRLEKNKEYYVKESKNKGYYIIYDNGVELATISESEYKLFFENKEV